MIPTQTLKSSPREKGQALTEFIILIPILIGISLLCIEMGRWYIHRQLLHYALYEASRAGSKDHANPHTIQQAFIKATLPLFAIHGKKAQQYQAQYFKQYPWKIQQLSPTPKDFQQYAILNTPKGRGIPNTFLSERPKGIYQANTLELQLDYRHKLLIPFIARLIGEGKDYIVISIRQKQFMQTHALYAGKPLPINTPTTLIATSRQKLHSMHFAHATSIGIPKSTPIERSVIIVPKRDEKCGVSLCCEDESQ